MTDPSNIKYPVLRMYIDGEWLNAVGRATHRVVDPATGETLGELPLADVADLDRALDAARRGFTIWRNTPPAARGRVLIKAAELLRQRRSNVALNATREEGKLLGEASLELEAAADLLQFYGEEARRIYGRVPPAGERHLIAGGPGACRTRRRVRAMEFSHPQSGAQARRAVGRRLLGHPEACRGSPGIGNCGSRGARGSRLPGRGRSASLRGAGPSIPPPAYIVNHPQAQFHRFDNRRQASAPPGF